MFKYSSTHAKFDSIRQLIDTNIAERNCEYKEKEKKKKSKNGCLWVHRYSYTHWLCSTCKLFRLILYLV